MLCEDARRMVADGEPADGELRWHAAACEACSREFGYLPALRGAASRAAQAGLEAWLHRPTSFAAWLKTPAAGPVGAALNRVASECRLALWLCDGLGFSGREAADLTGCDPSAIRARLSRGRRSLGSIYAGKSHAV